MTVTANDERRVRQHLQLNATSDGGGAISKVTPRWASLRSWSPTVGPSPGMRSDTAVQPTIWVIPTTVGTAKTLLKGVVPTQERKRPPHLIPKRDASNWADTSTTRISVSAPMGSGLVKGVKGPARWWA